MGDKPFREGLPTNPQFVMKDEKNFEEEKEKLISSIKRFNEGKGANLTTDPHPFFGKMSIDEWDKLFFKHIDHHLRQFGT